MKIFYKYYLIVISTVGLGMSFALAQSDLVKNPEGKKRVSNYSIELVKLNKPGIDKSSLEEMSKSNEFFFRISATGPEGYRESVISKRKDRDIAPKWSTSTYDDVKLGIIHNIIETQEVQNEDYDKISKIIKESKLWSLGKQEKEGPYLSGFRGVRIEMSYKGKYKSLYYFSPEFSDKQNDKIFVNETKKILKDLNFKISSYLYNLELVDDLKKEERKSKDVRP